MIKKLKSKIIRKINRNRPMPVKLAVTRPFLADYTSVNIYCPKCYAEIYEFRCDKIGSISQVPEYLKVKMHNVRFCQYCGQRISVKTISAW